MKYIDITPPISSSLATWQNSEPGASLAWPIKIGENGSECSVSILTIGSHLGAHIDAPLHFIENGNSIDKIPLETLIGSCFVADLTAFSGVEVPVELLKSANVPKGTRRLLLKTSSSIGNLLADPKFHSEFAALGIESAKWVAQQGIELIGFDYLSAAPASTENGGEVHRILLGAGIVIVEGLDLTQVAPGEYRIIALPLRTVGAEASPARIVLESAS